MQIHYAARRGDRERVLELLQRNVPVDERFEVAADDCRFDHAGEPGSTPLMWAARSRYADKAMLELLIAHGADVNVQSDSLYSTPLTAAVRSGNIEKVQYLLDQGADARFVDKNSYGVLTFPPSSTKLISLLVSAGADLNVESISSESLVSISSHCGNWDVLSIGLKLGADPSRLQWNSLMNTVVFGSVDEMRKHLEVDQLHMRDRWSRTAWLLAICVGDVEKAKLLKEAGAEIQDQGRGNETCLQCAILSGNTAMLEFLLELGIEVDMRDNFGRSALMHAIEANDLDAIRLLLQHGADIQAVDSIREKPINFIRGSIAARLLLDAGADVNYIDGTGEWPLKSATELQRHQLVLDLLSMGALPDVTSTGETALHDAVRNDELQTIKALIAAGASVNVQTVDGCGVLCYVRSVEAINILLGLTQE